MKARLFKKFIKKLLKKGQLFGLTVKLKIERATGTM